jgi:hypothetical protein
VEKKLGAKRNEWPPMHRWASNLSEQTRNVDGEMIKNDIAVLAINTLGQAVVELVSNGPKSTPGVLDLLVLLVQKYKYCPMARNTVQWPEEHPR